MQVVLELVLGLVLCMWAALTVPGKFLSIKPETDENRYDDVVLVSQLSMFLLQFSSPEFLILKF